MCRTWVSGALLGGGGRCLDLCQRPHALCWEGRQPARYRRQLQVRLVCTAVCLPKPSPGHAHPKVAAAVAQQLGTLNTNSRYLHQGLVQYSEALAATLPQPLEVRRRGCAGGRQGPAAGKAGQRQRVERGASCVHGQPGVECPNKVLAAVADVPPLPANLHCRPPRCSTPP
jgi:hypothetical protein